MFSFEKEGGLPREERRMEMFNEGLEECCLIDVRFLGSFFTWERGNLPKKDIRERLNTSVANAQ